MHIQVPGSPRQLLRLPEEETLLIGRDAPATIVLEDSFLSRSHLSVECRGPVITVADAGSRNGTFLNGVRIRQAVVSHGDAICAGRSFLRLTAMVDGRPARPLLDEPVQLEPLQLRLVETLREAAKFALLDGAIDTGVLEVLKGGGGFFQSLYEGEQAASIAPVGPYLVDLATAPELLPHLVQRGWGKSWGVWMRTAQSFQQVRHHLRTLLTVRSAEGAKLLFRFYDPRVLGSFVRTASAVQRRELFGEIEAFLLETGAEGEVLLLTPATERRMLVTPP